MHVAVARMNSEYMHVSIKALMKCWFKVHTCMQRMSIKTSLCTVLSKRSYIARLAIATHNNYNNYLAISIDL